jgi:D-aminopeptidase
MRARELGVVIGTYEPGPINAITDVSGVRVGHATLIEGTGIRTGVTAVVPDKVDRAGGQLAAGLFVGNGFGKLIGATQLAELGAIETPILLTGTLSAFRVADALVTYLLGLPGNEQMTTVNPVVGETNDAFLSDIRARPVTERHVRAAITAASAGPVAEGSVGAGTGTSALGFKAGIGTASRQLRLDDARPCTIGAIVQANFSGTLTVRGVGIPAAGIAIPPASALAGGGAEEGTGAAGEPQGNSCMIIVATDRDLDSRQLTRVARRAVFAMGRTGADFAGGSGDYAIAFATADGPPVRDAALDPVFAAAQDVVEEAILNSVFMATTVTGYRDHTRFAVPHEQVARKLRSAGILGPG